MKKPILFIIVTSFFFTFLACQGDSETVITDLEVSTSEIIDSIVPAIEEEEIEEEPKTWMDSLTDKLIYFAQAVIDNDTKTVGQLIVYPLERTSPLPPLQTKEELQANFALYFDAEMKEKLSDFIEKNEIIDQSGVNGLVGILYGYMWFNDAGELVKLNHQTEEEKVKRDKLDTVIRNNIHPILKDYTHNTYIGKTETYLFRIDETEKGLRYASWYSDETMNDEPDFILWNGEHEQQGSAGGWKTFFDNADTRYLLDQVWMCEDPATCGDFLIVQDEGEITSHEKVVQIFDPLEVLPKIEE